MIEFACFSCIANALQTTSSGAGPEILIILIAIPGFFAGPIVAMIIYSRYRNQSARHTHERETEVFMQNLQKSDVFKEKLKKHGSRTVPGENSYLVEGKSTRQDSASDITLDLLKLKVRK